MTTLAATLDRTSFLRRVLLVDAATCLATGALFTLDSSPLAPLLGLPPALLFYPGLALFPIAGFMLWVATRRSLPRPGAWLVVGGNVLWVAGSLLVLMVEIPTALGYAFVIAQGIVVALLAELEYTGLRRAAS